MTFWKQATTEEKLSQVDGGISLGMTAKQIAMNCRTTESAVRAFGRAQGRRFLARNSSGIEGGSVMRIMKAREAGASNVMMKDAFTIFAADEPKSLFFAHQND